MTRISILTILCQCESLDVLRTTAKELGCVDIRELYGSLHVMLPDGTRGSFRATHARGIGISNDFVWCAADSAE